jgi:hypothetical protein
MLQAAPWRDAQKPFGHQARQLLRRVSAGSVAFGVLDLARSNGVFGQNAAGQARHFSADEGQPPRPSSTRFLKANSSAGSGSEQKSPVKRQQNDLLAQLLQRAATACAVRVLPTCIKSPPFLQVGDVFLQVFERVLDLQRKQAAQPGTVFGSSHIWLVKHLNGDGVSRINQRRVTNQRLAAFRISSSSGSSPKVQVV